MKKNVISQALLAVLLFAGQAVFAQQNTKLVFATPAGYTSSYGTAITKTADGGFLLVGAAFGANLFGGGDVTQPRLIKLGASLAVEWDKTYLTPAPGHGILAKPVGQAVEMANGDFVLGLRNDSTNVEFLRIDADGGLLQAGTLSPDYAQNTQMLAALPSGNTLAARWQNGAGFQVVQIDAAGIAALQVTVPGIEVDNSAAVALPGGDVLVESFNFSTSEQKLFRLSPSGSVAFSADFPVGGTSLYGFADGSVGSYTYGGNTTGLFVQYGHYDGADGTLLDATAQLPSDGNLGYYSDTYPDGTLLVSGSTPTNRGLLRKVNPADGLVVWEAESPEDGQPHIKYLYACAATADGWGAAVGWTVSNQFAFLKIGINSGVSVNTLHGRVAQDVDSNCDVSFSEPGIGLTRIEATDGPETFQTWADQSGNYTLLLPAGTFDVTAHPSQLFFETCPTTPTSLTFLPGANNDLPHDFPMESQQTIHHLHGRASFDQNGDCQPAPTDPPTPNWSLRLSQGSQFLNLKTDANGEYSVFVADGSYTLELFPWSSSFAVCSPAVRPVNVAGPVAQDVVEDFDVMAEFNCAAMQTAIVCNAVRPCSTRVVEVAYQNVGTLTALGATLDLTVDPALTVLSASLPYTTLVNGDLHFELGDVPPFAGGGWSTISLTVLASCDLQIGQQVCLTSHVAPDVPCANSNWQGAIIDVAGVCTGDSAIFTIKNIGLGPQVAPLDFIIVEDQIVLKTGTFNLPPGGTTTEAVDMVFDSTTVSNIADQEPGAPANDPVIFSLTGCTGTGGGTPTGTGGTSGLFTAQGCFAVVNSFDPNDKEAFPLGYGPAHLVRPGTPLEYTIRFQNTGNDTAFTVVLRDTLPAALDFSRIEAIAASHPFSFAQVSDSVLHVRFDNIALPDSGANQAASQGWFLFRAHPRPGLPDGTVADNRAAIYFDQNPPVMTNTVRRTFGEYFTVSTDAPAGPGSLKIEAAPNPFTTEVAFRLPAEAPASVYFLEITDVRGGLLRSQVFSGKECRLLRDGLPGGLFFWKISSEGRAVASGKIVAGE